MRLIVSQCLFIGLVGSQLFYPVYPWIIKPATTQPASARQEQRILSTFLLSKPSSIDVRSKPLGRPFSFALRSSSSTAVTDHLTQNDTHQQQDSQQPPPALRELYPPSVAYRNGTLQVDSIHSLYYEVHGNQSFSTSNAKKKSALFLHGGPGAGCNPNHARFFDPNQYDTIVLVDQRGCGKSTPRGQVYNNSLMHLVEDCERLREFLLVQDDPQASWDVVLGGSWGSTLATAYAQEYPQHVKSIILRGVCLLRRAEVDWLFTPQGGAARQNPQAWNQFAATVGMNNTDIFANDDNTKKEAGVVMIDRSVLHAYYDRFFSKNATDRWNAARGWMTWEFAASSAYKQKLAQMDANSTPSSPAVLVSHSNSYSWSYEDSQGTSLSMSTIEESTLEDSAHCAAEQLRQGLLHPVATVSSSSSTPKRPIALDVEDFEDPQIQEEKVGNFSGFPAMPMLTCFYSVNDRYAMNDVDLISAERMEHIQHIPCIAVQGGLDPICPPDTALDLKQHWPGMEIRIPLNAGHSMYHPELAHELVQATDRLAKLP